MPTHLERKNLIIAQEMEVVVNGPDGATHLILCTGIANLGSINHEIYTFFVGPQLSRRQFVGVIASGALSRIQAYDNDPAGNHVDVKLGADLVSIGAGYDAESGQVKVRVEVSSSKAITQLGISYNVSILSELPVH